jgi:hypothetical protein
MDQVWMILARIRAYSRGIWARPLPRRQRAHRELPRRRSRSVIVAQSSYGHKLADSALWPFVKRRIAANSSTLLGPIPASTQSGGTPDASNDPPRYPIRPATARRVATQASQDGAKSERYTITSTTPGRFAACPVCLSTWCPPRGPDLSGQFK